MADSPEEGWPICDVWKKYEDIAMHFNDLLIRLRTQALAGVAAIVALVGFVAKIHDVKLSWEMAIAGFFILALFWIAIWIMDFQYYNRLLAGAVIALLEVEKLSKTQTHIRHINLSTTIEDAVVGALPTAQPNSKIMQGPRRFYILVLIALACGLVFSILEFICAEAG